jgi:hypothetical protein
VQTGGAQTIWGNARGVLFLLTPGHRLAVVLGHPTGGAGHQFLGVPLQFDQYPDGPLGPVGGAELNIRWLPAPIDCRG